MTRRILPDLYRAIADGGHELAIGTRYAADGSTGEWDEGRLQDQPLRHRASPRRS